jgi:hypothetical protein
MMWKLLLPLFLIASIGVFAFGETARAALGDSTILTPTFQTTQPDPAIAKALSGTVVGSTATQVPPAVNQAPGTTIPASGGTSVPQAGFTGGSNIPLSGGTSVPQ